MQITGAETIVFGVEDLEAAKRFCVQYGLQQIEANDSFARFAALDGSGLELRKVDDASLPPAIRPGSTARLTIWGVKDQATLDAIRAELSKDREVTGTDLLVSKDDDGHPIAFRITKRHSFEVVPARANAPGARARSWNDCMDPIKRGVARTLGHVVFWSNNPQRAMDFYTKRLGFRFTDGVGEVGKLGGLFARAAGHSDHHSLFFLSGMGKFPNSMQHVEFQFTDFQEVMTGGEYLVAQGWKTHMGPGRHLLGSNWYWYFETPMGCHFELSADMDQVDDNWTPRVVLPAQNRGLQPTWEGPQMMSVKRA